MAAKGPHGLFAGLGSWELQSQKKGLYLWLLKPGVLSKPYSLNRDKKSRLTQTAFIEGVLSLCMLDMPVSAPGLQFSQGSLNKGLGFEDSLIKGFIFLKHEENSRTLATSRVVPYVALQEFKASGGLNQEPGDDHLDCF